MGYRTDFSLVIRDDVNKEITGDETLSKRLDAYRSTLVEFDDLKELLDNDYLHSKWYSFEEDMIDLSLAVQDVVFELHAKGEEDDDRWICYFLNGKKQLCNATVTITYPEFNLESFS